MHNRNIRGRREKRTEEIFETIMTMNFSKLMLSIKPQIQEENIKQDKWQEQNQTNKKL